MLPKSQSKRRTLGSFRCCQVQLRIIAAAARTVRSRPCKRIKAAVWVVRTANSKLRFPRPIDARRTRVILRAIDTGRTTVGLLRNPKTADEADLRLDRDDVEDL